MKQKFVEFTKETGEPLVINTDQILWFEQHDLNKTQTTIFLNAEGPRKQYPRSLALAEAYEIVKKRLEVD